LSPFADESSLLENGSSVRGGSVPGVRARQDRDDEILLEVTIDRIVTASSGRGPQLSASPVTDRNPDTGEGHSPAPSLRSPHFESRRPDSLILLEGTHWRHFPSEDSDALAIIYAPVNLASPKLPHYERTSRLRCARLLINPGTNNFYQDCIAGVSDVVARISSRYARTIHFGFSAGAYAALRFGVDDSRCVGIYAIAPHFVLDRPMTRSFLLSKTMSEDRRDVDIIDAINNARIANVRVLIPCMDSMDGVQVRDSRRIENDRVEIIYRMLEHKIFPEDMPDVVIDHFLDAGCFPPPLADNLATSDELDDATAMYDMMLAVSARTRVDDTIVNRNPRSALFMYCKGRYLESANNLVDALPSYAAAVALGKDRGSGSLYDMLIVMGNAYFRAGFADIAIGSYRAARRIGLKNPTSYVREADALFSGGRFDEFQQLENEYVKNIGVDETLNRLIARNRGK
jgi:hypothetical protein